MFGFGLCKDLERISENVLRLDEEIMGFHND